MATNTTNYNFTLPGVADPVDADLWGGQLNGNWASLDTLLLAASNVVTRSESSGPVATSTTDRNKLLLVDATSAAITVNLLAAATAEDGFEIAIKKTDSSSNAVTIDGNAAETIDGATTLVLSSENNSAVLVCDGSNWSVSASQIPTIVPPASETEAGIVEKATAAEVAAETADKYPDAALLTNHPGIAKVTAYVNANGTLGENYNVSSVTDNGTGDHTVNYSITMANANHHVASSVHDDSRNRTISVWATTTSSARIVTAAATTGGATEQDFSISVFGALA